MARHCNRWSFILTLFCLALFASSAFSSQVKTAIFHWTGVHPLWIVLCLSLAAFFLSFLGLFSINNWLTALRIGITLMMSFSLSVILIFVLAIGQLLS
ncbi:hypothetical protein [Brevibacillus brevis]|uniref:Uncharacterized protein n=1 Tax=Brevibacillus brevis TaxID=1393 RepID=A0ABY9TBY3_BREBE|nr:hypothetical protein [Brevibacillus brevis]WNC17374.1 hypothetical protein RGB73_14025 [Brevibacillus brevis]